MLLTEIERVHIFAKEALCLYPPLALVENNITVQSFIPYEMFDYKLHLIPLSSCIFFH